MYLERQEGLSMCIICIELQKGNLLPWEAYENLREMAPMVGREHFKEAREYIRSAQMMSTCEWCDCDPCDCDGGE